MYYPYFRGKQFELITIRECAELLARKGFVPIIEPVKEALGGLKKAIEEVRKANGKVVVIVNPYHGDHSSGGGGISQLIKGGLVQSGLVSAGILLRESTSCDDALELCKAYDTLDSTVVHAGFLEPGELAKRLVEENIKDLRHVFVDDMNTGLLYRKHFGGSIRVLIHDGFERQRNADYPQTERFSELHVTYTDLGMSGFGDFLIVGDDYSEGGGPAYAVAIHLTYIDPDKDDVMYVYHFVSDRNDTPTDPAGKFAEALQKLIDRLDSGNSKLYETEAIKEFRTLHEKGHFPGLGYVKKLSMKHHIETLANYFS